MSEHAPTCMQCGRPCNAPKPPPPEPTPSPRRVNPDILALTGGAFLALGLGCLVTGKARIAAPALGLGLALTLAGALWGWLARE